MGDFHPEAHVKGFAGCNFIALICNSCLAIISDIFSMTQSYKVFFKDRVIFLTNQIDDVLGGEFNAILKYGSQNELKQFIENFTNKQHLHVGFIYYHDIEMLLELFKKQFVCLQAAGGLVTNQRNEFLTIERLGVYDLPKGKTEPNETAEETAQREIFEECGIDHLTIVRPLGSTFHTYRLNNEAVLKETHWFHMHTTIDQKPTPQASENITVARWIDSREMEQFASRTYESIKEVLSSFRQASEKR